MTDRATFAAFAQAPRRRYGPLSLTEVPSRLGHVGDPPRVAYQVGRRVGGAVVRNRLRRRLRALIHDRAPDLAPGTAYLIGASPEAAAWTTERLGEALDGLLALSPTSATTRPTTGPTTGQAQDT